MYADLTKSHAIVCTIAAFLESMFRSALPLIRRSPEAGMNPLHPRVISFAKSGSGYWDIDKPDRQSTAQKVCDILEGAAVISYFGPDFAGAVKAIFAYRNAVIHRGYHWDPTTGRDFHRQWKAGGWSRWVTPQGSVDDPQHFTITQSGA